jgi:hypothetical protein
MMNYAIELLRKLFPNRSVYRPRRRSKYNRERTGQGMACLRKAKSLGVKNLGEKVTRQQIRAGIRAECFRSISEQFGGEPRRIRRSIALSLAHRRYKQQTTGVLANA